MQALYNLLSLSSLFPIPVAPPPPGVIGHGYLAQGLLMRLCGCDGPILNDIHGQNSTS